MATKRSDAQPLVILINNCPRKIRECHAKAYGFLRLWYKIRGQEIKTAAFHIQPAVEHQRVWYYLKP